MCHASLLQQALAKPKPRTRREDTVQFPDSDWLITRPLGLCDHPCLHLETSISYTHAPVFIRVHQLQPNRILRSYYQTHRMATLHQSGLVSPKAARFPPGGLASPPPDYITHIHTRNTAIGASFYCHSNKNNIKTATYSNFIRYLCSHHYGTSGLKRHSEAYTTLHAAINQNNSQLWQF